MMDNSKEATRTRIDIKKTTIGTILAVVGAVALPQLLHVFGAVTGLGTLPGETYLPMHLPVMLAGFLAGPACGFITGALSPVVSAALTGMPAPAMMPFMVVELAGYGLAAGLLKNDDDSAPVICAKVFAVQFAGRAARAVAILIAFYGLGMTAIAPPVIWNSVIAGIPGMIIQLVLIPVIMVSVNRK